MSRSGASFFAGSARNCGHAGYPRDPRPPRATRTPEEQAYDASSVMKRLHYGNCPCTSRLCSFTRSSRTGISLYEQFAALQGETTLLDIFWNFNTATSVCVIDARTISFIFFFFFFWSLFHQDDTTVRVRRVVIKRGDEGWKKSVLVSSCLFVDKSKRGLQWDQQTGQRKHSCAYRKFLSTYCVYVDCT